jgi:hypothetical protein
MRRARRARGREMYRRGARAAAPRARAAGAARRARAQINRVWARAPHYNSAQGRRARRPSTAIGRVAVTERDDPRPLPQREEIDIAPTAGNRRANSPAASFNGRLRNISRELCRR